MPLIDTQPDAVARMYARSLYQLAQSQGGRAKVEEVLTELEDILELTRADKRFGEFMSSRALSADARAASLTKIFAGRVTPLTLNFLQVLNEKGRIASLPTIASAYDSIVQEAFGRVEVDVITAAPLDGAGTDAIKSRLAKHLGRDVIVHSYTEPAMIGGVKFRIGDQLIDASVGAKLRKIKEQISTGGAAAIRAKISKMIEGD